MIRKNGHRFSGKDHAQTLKTVQHCETKNREGSMTITGRTELKSMLFGIGLVAAAATPALAQKGLDEPFQDSFKQSLAGKTVAYVPVAMNFGLTEGWFAAVKKELPPHCVKWIVQHPNWSTNDPRQPT